MMLISYNYRGITLSPIISKLFEVVLLSMCSDVLKTDSLQFGFKEKVGTVDAIFTLTSTIKHVTDRGSSVYLSSLDIRKAFDRVNHYKMYMSLLAVGVPVIIVDVHATGTVNYIMLYGGIIKCQNILQ